MEILGWLRDNWVALVAVVGGIVMGSSIIVKSISPLTASHKDDNFATLLDKIHKFLSKIALNPPLPPLPPTEAELKALEVKAKEVDNAQLAAKVNDLMKKADESPAAPVDPMSPVLPPV